MKSKKAFTLIELLVVIAIIGLLATISVIALNNARAKARDAKRVADVKQIQTALELFFNDEGRYPTSVEWSSGAIASFSSSTGATTTYMAVIPAAPTPADGNCSNSDNTYAYSQISAGANYRLSFCIGNTVGSLTPGGRYGADSSGFSPISATSAICTDVHQECDPSCPIGSTCGGGTLISVNPNLVAAPSRNQEGGCVGNQSCSLDDNVAYVFGPSFPDAARNYSDGSANIATLKAYVDGTWLAYTAAKLCDDLDIYGYSNWYLPSSGELSAVYSVNNRGLIAGMFNSYYWSSTNYCCNASGEVINLQNGSLSHAGNNDSWYVRCTRSF